MAQKKPTPTFTWPSVYTFPPFFTLQPNAETRSKQVTAWCQMIKDYYRAKGLYELSVQQARNEELFNNEAIGRRASDDLIQEVLKELVQKGNAELMPDGRYIVYWRSLDEWAKIIYDYIVKRSMTDQVLTIYELHSGDETEGEEFHGMDLTTFRNAIERLEYQGKATVFQGNETDGDGVKFFGA
eukprot:comp11734_c0_seq1/m.6321 comp11734_c0_seq1/g.6321  ORF comp11734_c0_seq1/g.6321 comp11734_c0_seq1/m.6321 type:complete len:184 (-) comp11734_c0_seq1:78-629(-)